MRDDLTDLIAKIEAAPEGSRKLDAALLLAVADPLDQHPGWQKEITDCLAQGWTPDPVKWAHRAAPHYTLMLDAKLPGEEIVRVARSYDYGGWRWHATAWNGVELPLENRWFFDAAGSTEALARRAAALRAIQHERELHG